MMIRDFMRRWLRVRGGLALLFGLGALSGGDARADILQDRQDPTAAPGDLLIRTDEAGILVSERGQGFKPLRLGDTPEARILMEMLANERAASDLAGVRVGPTILAGGGGSGFSWTPAPTHPNAGAATPPVKSAPSQQTTAPSGQAKAPDKQG